MMMSTQDWLIVASIAVGVVLAIGGFAGTCIVGFLTYMVKRLISSVDRLREDINRLDLSLKDKPNWDQAKQMMREISKDVYYEIINNHGNKKRRKV